MQKRNKTEIRHIDIDGIVVRYEVSGPETASPLVLMHGWGCKLDTVRSIAQTAELTHRVYNIDLPGFGDSTEPDTTWGIDDYTRFIEVFTARLGVENPVLVGHSFGGRISILYASRNVVSKVVLVDAAGIKPTRTLKYYLKVYSFKAARKVVGFLFPKAKANRIIERMRNRRGSADYNSASPRMKAILSRVVNEDLTDRLPLIKAPTLLIWGDHDTATPIKDARKMEKLVPDAGLVAFEGAGHYSFLDEPVRFRAVLGSFLQS